MNALRSSPLSDLDEASALHFFIFSCWLGVVDAFRHSDMHVAGGRAPRFKPSKELKRAVR